MSSSGSPGGVFLPRQRVPLDEPVGPHGPVVASYRDLLSGCTFLAATPTGQPRLWQECLRGALRSYRLHDVESVLEYDRIADGASTALFFVAQDASGTVVGGMRVQGRYTEAAQAHAVQEWDGRQGAIQLEREIQDRLADGVIEMKSGWVDERTRNRRPLTDAMARTFVHSLRLLNVRYALGTVAEHAMARWSTTGGVVSQDVCPVAYPDERYRTVPMWWDRSTFADLAVPEQLPHILYEAAQLPDSHRWAAAAIRPASDRVAS